MEAADRLAAAQAAESGDSGKSKETNPMYKSGKRATLYSPNHRSSNVAHLHTVFDDDSSDDNGGDDDDNGDELMLAAGAQLSAAEMERRQQRKTQRQQMKRANILASTYVSEAKEEVRMDVLSGAQDDSSPKSPRGSVSAGAGRSSMSGAGSDASASSGEEFFWCSDSVRQERMRREHAPVPGAPRTGGGIRVWTLCPVDSCARWKFASANEIDSTGGSLPVAMLVSVEYELDLQHVPLMMPAQLDLPLHLYGALATCCPAAMQHLADRTDLKSVVDLALKLPPGFVYDPVVGGSGNDTPITDIDKHEAAWDVHDVAEEDAELLWFQDPHVDAAEDALKEADRDNAASSDYDEDDDDEIIGGLRHRAALWAVGHIGATEYGFTYLLGNVRRDIVRLLVRLSETSPVLSMRGVYLTVLGMFTRSEPGLYALLRSGWDFPGVQSAEMQERLAAYRFSARGATVDDEEHHQMLGNKPRGGVGIDVNSPDAYSKVACWNDRMYGEPGSRKATGVEDEEHCRQQLQLGQENPLGYRAGPFGCGQALPLVASPGRNRIRWFFSIHDNGRGQFWYDNGFGSGGDDTRWMPRYMGGPVAVLQSVLNPVFAAKGDNTKHSARPLIRPFVREKQERAETEQQENDTDGELKGDPELGTETQEKQIDKDDAVKKESEKADSEPVYFADALRLISSLTVAITRPEAHTALRKLRSEHPELCGDAKLMCRVMDMMQTYQMVSDLLLADGC